MRLALPYCYEQDKPGGLQENGDNPGVAPFHPIAVPGHTT